MAAEASRRLRRPVKTLLFHDLDKTEAYDGVWANACLLHLPRPELAQVLALIWRALRPGGHFYASYKAGDADGRDVLNRYSMNGPRCCSSWSGKACDRCPISQSILKIASASTACARKPTVKASVRNTGRPSV